MKIYWQSYIDGAWVDVGGGLTQLSSPQIMYHFLIEFLELVVSCLGLGEGGCDCTALAMH